MHEVLPVTAGYRLTLIYNLVHEGMASPPSLPGVEHQSQAIVSLLRQWVDAQRDDGEVPVKLVIPLEHAYTPAELAFSTLKNADAAAATVLAACATAAHCTLHLALLAIEESGSAEYHGHDSRGRGRWHHDDDEDDDDDKDEDEDEGEGGDADDFEIVEIIDSDLTLSDWRRPDGIGGQRVYHRQNGARGEEVSGVGG